MTSRRYTAAARRRAERNDASEADYGIRRGAASRLGLNDEPTKPLPPEAEGHPYPCDTFGCEICRAIANQHARDF